MTPESNWSVAQSCPTLCNPMDCSLQGSSVHGISQARMLEWVAISFSKGSSWPRDWTQVSYIAGRFFTIWATREAQIYRVATYYHIPLSMGFPRQECWSGLQFPSPQDLPNPVIEHRSCISLALQADSLSAEPLGKSKYKVKRRCCSLYNCRESLAERKRWWTLSWKTSGGVPALPLSHCSSHVSAKLGLYYS